VAVRVQYLDGDPNGLAAMIGGIIEGNLAAHPEREALLKPAHVGIVASDAGVALTLRLAPGRVTVANGLVGRPQVVIRSDSGTLTDLTSVPLRFGFPDATTPAGRSATKKLLRGELKVQGLALHPGMLSRLNRLLSVA
jgi:hypothetical protein